MEISRLDAQIIIFVAALMALGSAALVYDLSKVVAARWGLNLLQRRLFLLWAALVGAVLWIFTTNALVLFALTFR